MLFFSQRQFILCSWTCMSSVVHVSVRVSLISWWVSSNQVLADVTTWPCCSELTVNVDVDPGLFPVSSTDNFTQQSSFMRHHHRVKGHGGAGLGGADGGRQRPVPQQRPGEARGQGTVLNRADQLLTLPQSEQGLSGNHIDTQTLNTPQWHQQHSWGDKQQQLRVW